MGSTSTRDGVLPRSNTGEKGVHLSIFRDKFRDRSGVARSGARVKGGSFLRAPASHFQGTMTLACCAGSGVAHVRLAAPAKPKAATIQATTINVAGRNCMNASSRMLGPEIHPLDVVHGAYQHWRDVSSVKCRARSALENVAIGSFTRVDEHHPDTARHVECAHQIATHGDTCVECGRMHRKPCVATHSRANEIA